MLISLRYHWALLVGPKNESDDSQGHRFHIRDRITKVNNQAVIKWEYDGAATKMSATTKLLIRVVIGKVKDQPRLEAILKSVPMQPNKKDWNCVEWVKEAHTKLIADGKTLGTCIKDWDQIRDQAMAYVTDKKAKGRWTAGSDFDPFKAPTLNLLNGAELAA